MPNQKDFYQVSLKVFLKNDKGEVLILSSREDSIYKGFYDLPGGRINFDEFKTPFDKIIKRELTEEIGEVKFDLTLKPVGLGRASSTKTESPLGGPAHALNVFFEAKYIKGDIKISEEHTGFQWVKLTKDNLEQYFKIAILEGAKMYLENLGGDSYKI
ncbi:MAG: NUDIX domain-containing protein [Candidatus Pacebacteria bacterium]|nr:NUDIX domain-containing protein [Candidatus Paceibacterota bacterium]